MAHLTLSIVLGSVVLLAGCRSGSVQEAPNARAQAVDFEVLIGHDWTGTFDYRGEATGSVRSAPSTLRVTSTADGAWTITTRSDNPNWADEQCHLRLKDGGAVIRRGTQDEPVVLRRVQGGTTEIITEFTSNHHGTPATIRNKYIVASRECSFRTLVLTRGAADYFKRCDYHWTW